MNAEFFEAIEELEKEKGIPREYMYDKIRQAMLAALLFLFTLWLFVLFIFFLFRLCSFSSGCFF